MHILALLLSGKYSSYLMGKRFIYELMSTTD